MSELKRRPDASKATPAVRPDSPFPADANKQPPSADDTGAVQDEAEREEAQRHEDWGSARRPGR